ncbi:MAG: ABC transporter ATP-binding protein [Bacillota bacterium]
MNEKAIIRLNNVTKEYLVGEVVIKAIAGISFEVYPGELIVVLGPSGAGKSTALNIIGGMDRPTSGEIWVEDRNIATYSDRELTFYRRKKIGFVFQFYNLMPNLTALENVELAAQISDDPLDIMEIMAAVELDRRLDNFPAQLSGGEQQRVAIARAVAKNPLLLLCDEPTGALDYQTGKSILKLLGKVNQELRKSVMIITHNAALAAMAHRVIRIKNGLVEGVQLNERPEPVERIEW